MIAVLVPAQDAMVIYLECGLGVSPADYLRTIFIYQAMEARLVTYYGWGLSRDGV